MELAGVRWRLEYSEAWAAAVAQCMAIRDELHAMPSSKETEQPWHDKWTAEIVHHMLSEVRMRLRMRQEERP